MLLRGVRFKYAFGQSGVQNFGGEGQWFHRYLRWCGLTFNNCTFVAKTTTLASRRGSEFGEEGNLRLLADGMTPAEHFPDCFHCSLWNWFQGAALNALGLAGPGLYLLLRSRMWHKLTSPFMISVMAVSKTRAERLDELRQIVSMIRSFLPFQADFGIQLNISCPNVKHEQQEIDQVVSETRESLAILRELGMDIPLFAKINALFPIRAALEICKDDNCDGLCNSNTIWWADLPEDVRLKYFGRTTSPLAKYGGGGLSGADYLFGLVEEWIRRARAAGLTKPIIAGGGLLKPKHVNILAHAGASAIAVGSVAFLRPWRMQSIIDRANELGRAGLFYKC